MFRKNFFPLQIEDAIILSLVEITVKVFNQN